MDKYNQKVPLSLNLPINYSSSDQIQMASLSRQQQAAPNTNQYLTPSYLLGLSSHIETLSTFYTQESLPSLAPQYKSFLQSTFKGLSNYLTLFQEDQNMIISSLLNTRVQMDLYLGQKLFYLLQKDTRPLAEIVKFILIGYRENAEHYEEVLIRQKKKKVEVQNQKNQKIVNNLRKEVLIKREYVKELQDRIKDLEEENSKIYQKIIQNAKSSISNTLIQSKALVGSSQFVSTAKYSRTAVSPQLNQNYPVSHKISHKQLSLKQVQETILQLLTLKKKQQSISLKRTPVKSYLKHYFRYKFGLNQLCQQMKCNFLSALKFFLSSSSNTTARNNDAQKMQGLYRGTLPQKPLLLLFSKLLEEQIDEQYFWRDYFAKGEKVLKVFKRFLNEKQKIELKQLDRLYDGTAGISGSIPNYSTNKILTNQSDRKDLVLGQTDVRYILLNIYKSNAQVETLHMIFNEIISKSPRFDSENQFLQDNAIFIPNLSLTSKYSRAIYSKQLFNMVLCYEIQSYSLKLAQLTRIIKKHSNSSQFACLNYNGLQKTILELQLSEQKYLPFLQKNYEELKAKEFTYSEMVEVISGQIIAGNSQAKNSQFQPNHGSNKII